MKRHQLTLLTGALSKKPEEVAVALKTAHAIGKGMLGMKILGEGQIADKIDRSLSFIVGLGRIDACNIGFLNKGEVEDTITRVVLAI